MRLLITGIHGFVGANLVKALSKDHEIYGLDIVSPEKEGVMKTYSWDDLENGSLPEGMPLFIWQERLMTRRIRAGLRCISK